MEMLKSVSQIPVFPTQSDEEEKQELKMLGLWNVDEGSGDEAEGDLKRLAEGDGAEEGDAANDVAEEEEDDMAWAKAAMRRQRCEHEERVALLKRVHDLNTKMEKAVEDDERDVREGRPGPRKLAMIPEIEDVAKNVRAHPLLVQSGFIGLLKGFLEPLVTAKTGCNGRKMMALPHPKVRATVYKLLGALPISTHSQEGRTILKQANIGPVLKFYAKVKDETEANRRTVNELLNRWMSPIIEEGRKATKDAAAEREREEAEMRLVKKRRVLDEEKEVQERLRMERASGVRAGNPGFQYHAKAPRQARPDYVRAPRQATTAVSPSTGAKSPKKRGLIAKLNSATRKLIKHNKRGADRSSKVEISTKNIGLDIPEPVLVQN